MSEQPSNSASLTDAFSSLRMRRGKTRTVGAPSMARWQVLWTMLPLALAPAPTLGQTITNLASLPMLFTCLAQELDLRAEFMEELRKRNPDEAGEAKWGEMLEDSPWAACVRQKKWVSKTYCTDLPEANVRGSRGDVARMMEKHWPECQGLKSMVDYFDAAFPGGRAGARASVSCPE